MNGLHDYPTFTTQTRLSVVCRVWEKPNHLFALSELISYLGIDIVIFIKLPELAPFPAAAEDESSDSSPDMIREIVLNLDLKDSLYLMGCRRQKMKAARPDEITVG